MKKLLLGFFFVCVILLFAADQVLAQEDKFINIVNPVRIAPYTNDVSENLRSQYSVVSDYALAATWLVTYDVLDDPDAVNELRKFDPNQELGLFLEVGEKLAADSGVPLSEGFWHHANVVFLSGYTQRERLKLVDTLFNKFKEKFGYYPSSVGSWWTDSYSLSYMHEKYGISANLAVADQFSTDRYQVWGGYWAMPYYPCRYHTAIPASKVEAKIPVVVLQWAPRDPINGYYNSLFSTQDYFTGQVNEDIDYYKKILSLYLNEAGEFGQVTIGLEGDLSPDSYSGHYRTWLRTARELVDTGAVRAVTMSEFAHWYRLAYPGISPAHLIHTKDLRGENKEITWYQNPNFRIGVLTDNDKKETKIIDLRIYNDDFKEPYYEWPNRGFDLLINVPSLYDEVSYKDSVKGLSYGAAFDPTKFEPDITISPYTFRGLTPEAAHMLRSKKLILGIILATVLLLVFIYKSRRRRIVFLVIFSLGLLGVYLYPRATQDYYVSQAEVDALRKIEGGAVLVYDNECLQCEWYGEYQPAVFANRRDYVGRLTGGRVVYNKAFFESENIEQAKREFDRLDVNYIYLVNYGYYKEDIPVSPGDIGVERVYKNANAEVWRVKDE